MTKSEALVKDVVNKINAEFFSTFSPFSSHSERLKFLEDLTNVCRNEKEFFNLLARIKKLSLEGGPEVESKIRHIFGTLFPQELSALVLINLPFSFLRRISDHYPTIIPSATVTFALEELPSVKLTHFPRYSQGS